MKEVEDCLAKYGLRPVQWLDKIGLLGPNVIAAHVIHVTDEEIELLARHQGEEIALVAHGGVNRVILLDAIGAPLSQMFHIEQGYGCRNIIDYFSDGCTTVQLLNG